MYRNLMKRVLDIIFGIIALPFLLVLCILIGSIIILQDKGGMFYNAPRLGRDGKVFKMYKFRSMKINAPDVRNGDGSTYNSEDDPRLTKIGKFIRKTSIDELPQILNILKGDMSIIGPRPDLPEHLNIYSGQEIRKLEVSPGITGFNQAYYRNTVTWKQRIQNDIYYVDNLSFLLDLKIIFKTIGTVLGRKNVFIENNTNDSSENNDNYKVGASPYERISK
jgi:undecaprenyl phosphate N,N'-diacetylbacillosamine 1-phosphate transferase